MHLLCCDYSYGTQKFIAIFAIKIPMPEICRFYGIIIRMFFRDHLPPHFHVEYGEYKAKINIIDGEMIEGPLPRKALRLVQAWAEIHKDELLKNYEQSLKEGGIISRIEPLK
jgi:Domain of unknown function (DUF4160)